MILAILQARVSSTRLPGKVMKEILGKPMILHQIQRINNSKLIDGLVVATSLDPSDDQLVKTLTNENVAVRRGELNNVVSRFALVVDEFMPETIVRLTADCPLTDSEVIDNVIETHLRLGADYTSNVLDRTFPDGLDVECFSREAFERLLNSDLTLEEKEHVTLGFFSPMRTFSLAGVSQNQNLSDLRWTVDVAEDFDFVEGLYSKLYPANHNFGQKTILEYLNKYPQFSRTELDYVQN